MSAPQDGWPIHRPDFIGVQARHLAEQAFYMGNFIRYVASFFRICTTQMVRWPGLLGSRTINPDGSPALYSMSVEFICAVTDPTYEDSVDVLFNYDQLRASIVHHRGHLQEGSFSAIERPHPERTPSTFVYQPGSCLALVRESRMDAITAPEEGFVHIGPQQRGHWRSPGLTFQMHTFGSNSSTDQGIITTYTCRCIPDELYDFLLEEARWTPSRPIQIEW
jgi:hypothetical protein